MAVMVLLEVRAQDGTGDELVAAFKDVLPDTRAYEGFLDIVVYQNQDDPDNLVLVERWESKGAHQNYVGWRQEAGTLDQIMAASATPPSIRYYDITDA